MFSLIKKVKYYYLTIAVILIPCFIGCNETQTPTTKNVKKDYHPSFIPIPDSIDFEDITSSLLIYKSYDYVPEYSRYFTSSGVFAAFFNSGDYSVNSGFVSLNSDTLERYSSPTGGQNPDSMYSYTIQPYNDISFNESNYAWDITGSNDYSSFSFQISSPDHEASITSPSNGANININQTLTVSWETTQNEADKVKILLVSSGAGVEKYVDDTGSCTFSSNELLNLGTGEISLEVTVGNFKLVELSGKYALGMILSTHNIQCTLTP